jgi:spore germination protein
VIRQGDTLWSLSNRFGVSVDSIINANQLQNLPYLVIGQTLVIPTTETAYMVRPGDTLWSISVRFNTTVNSIASLNNITNQNQIFPGMVLRIPELSQNYGYIETNAYIEPSTAAADTELTEEAAPYLTYISPFSYTVKADGTLNSLNDQAILSAARPFRTAPLMVITNFRDGNFDTSLVDQILYSESIQQALINNVIEIMRNKNFYGLNIDFERITPENRQLYNTFLRRVTARLRP